MSDTLEDLLRRLSSAGPDVQIPQQEILVRALESQNVLTCSDLLRATATASARRHLQEEVAAKAEEEQLVVPRLFIEGLQLAVHEGRLAYSGFPEPPPRTGTPILFTAPHALHLQRPGHKPHKPESYTQHFARDFAQMVGGAFLTWTRREERRNKVYFEANGVPDPTNADPNFTHWSDMDVSPWTRNLREVRDLFGRDRICLHVDIHGCKDPTPDSGSDVVVGLGALFEKHPDRGNLFRTGLTICLAYIALKGYRVNCEPARLTGVSPDGDRRTLTQQSVSGVGGNWAYAVQLELSRSIRREMSRNKELRFMFAKAIIVAWSLACAWNLKSPCPVYPVDEVEKWLIMCRDFHERRVAAAAPQQGGSADCGDDTEAADAADADGGDADEGDAEDAAEDLTAGVAEGTAAVGVAASRDAAVADDEEVTANNEPPVDCRLEPIQTWWVGSWVARLPQDPKGLGTAASLEEWLDKAMRVSRKGEPQAQEGRSNALTAKSEAQYVREWLRVATLGDHTIAFQLELESSRNQSKACYIVGTWSNFAPLEMEWDGLRFTYLLEIGDSDWESFQLTLDEKFGSVMYPSVNDANPYISYSLHGPDNKGHGKNWTIGTPPGKKRLSKKNSAQRGQQYRIVVWVDKKMQPVRVTWKLWQ